MVDRLRLSRSQIAKIVGNDPEAIKQFEALFSMAATQDASFEEIALAAGTADNKAGQALSELQRIADALETIALAPVPQPQIAPDDLSPPLQANNSVTTDYIDLNLNPKHYTTTGRINWNNFDQTIEAGLDYGVVQQIGLETYFRVQNVTGVTIPNGTVVGYSGVGTASEIQVRPYIADGSDSSFNVIGVMTHDLPDSGETGYCTVLGKVRDLDTSAWAVGDILYCSETTAGALTNVKPTAPNNVIPIGMVLVSDATAGIINVRGVVEQQKHYGEFTETTSIVPAAVNTAYAMTFTNTEIALGISVASSSQITIAQSGLYQMTVRVQFTATNANLKSAWLWYRKNGTTDYTRSAVISSLSQNGGYRTLTATEFFTLSAGDYIQVMWAVDDTGLQPTNVAATAFAPSSPTARISVTQIQQ